MREEEHLKAFQEHKDVIDWAINRGIERSQRIIGAHISRGIVELLSAYLHKIDKIDAGFQVNHRWFKSEKAADKFPDFPRKEEIIREMVKIENEAEILTYGSQQPDKEIKEAVKLFNRMESILTELVQNDKNEE